MRRERRNRRALAWLLPVALAVGAAGCTNPESVAEDVLPAWFAAVQSGDVDALFCLAAGAGAAEELGPDPRAGFAAFARGELAAYLEGRDQGFVPLSGHGIRAVKLFVLGKGTFYEVVPGAADPGPGRLRVRTRLRFGYANVDLSSLSPGTTFYLAGDPPGRVVAIRVPRLPSRIEEEVLDTIELDWTFARQDPPPGCDARWAVETATPVEGSARTAVVVWNF